MPISFEKIGQYLHYLSEVHGVQFCIKDFCGFVAINKQLDETLRPFLAHTNPFCMYMKSDQEHYHTCLTMIRRMYHKCERLGRTYFGMCHAGLGEYVVPIFDGDVLLGSINAGFFQTNEGKTTRRICRACRQEPHSDAAGRYHDSSEDTILAHALEYIRINYKSRITVTALAEFCHCSDSYLSRIFKRRTGVNINVYVNKVRMEFAKSPLCLSDESIAEIAASVGFGDPNYISRVFTQIIGIPPTEFRKRFHQNNG